MSRALMISSWEQDHGGDPTGRSASRARAKLVESHAAVEQQQSLQARLLGGLGGRTC